MTIDVDDLTQHSRKENCPKTLFVIEDDRQKDSLNHPIRKRILRVLSAGIKDYETEVTTEVKTLKDGTGLTRSVEVRRPIKRYWMGVPEIAELLARIYPEHDITIYQCYYHLRKLEEQGLVEQDPPSELNDIGKKQRFKGLQFRSAARFFIYHKARFSQDGPNQCLEFLQDGWGLEPSEDDCDQLTQLISEQDQTLYSTLEHLVKHMNGSAVDSDSFSILLDRLAHVLLSDNEKFIECCRDAKRILVRSGGEHLVSDGTLFNGIEDAKKEEDRGKNNE